MQEQDKALIKLTGLAQHVWRNQEELTRSTLSSDIGPPPPLHCRSSAPLAGTVQRLLKVVLHHCGVARAVQCDRAGLECVLAAALTEPGMTVDVEVEYGGRGTFPITGVDRYLRTDRTGAVSRSDTVTSASSRCTSALTLTGALLRQSSFRMVVRMATRLHVLPSSLPVLYIFTGVRVGSNVAHAAPASENMTHKMYAHTHKHILGSILERPTVSQSPTLKTETELDSWLPSSRSSF